VRHKTIGLDQLEILEAQVLEQNKLFFMFGHLIGKLYEITDQYLKIGRLHILHDFYHIKLIIKYLDFINIS
jgi:hypothetical protein